MAQVVNLIPGNNQPQAVAGTNKKLETLIEEIKNESLILKIGDSITGGVTNGVLYQDSTDKLKNHANLTFVDGVGMVFSGTNALNMGTNEINNVTVLSVRDINNDSDVNVLDLDGGYINDAQGEKAIDFFERALWDSAGLVSMMDWSSAGTVDFGANDIITTGNLGIGTAAPNSELDVDGVISISGSDFIYIPGSPFTGSSFIGGGGGNLSYTSGNDGRFNTFSGIGTGVDITRGVYNAAFGYNAGANITTGSQNMYVGVNSGFTNITGTANVGIGYNTLFQGTGSYNVAIGGLSLDAVDGGSGNIGIGYVTLSDLNGTQNYNIAVGYAAGQFVASGADNMILGKFACRQTAAAANVTSVNTGTYIGSTTKPSAATGNSNEIVIGYNAEGKGTNTAVFGNDSITATYLKGDVHHSTKMIRSHSVYTGTDTTDNVYWHSCDSASPFTLTVTDGSDDGEEMVISNRGAGTVTLSGNISSVTATSSLVQGETITLRWDSTDGEWQ